MQPNQQSDQSKSDVKKVIFINLLIILLLVALFLINQKTEIVFKLGKLFKF
ncbi:MAG: hypothetical protein HY396_01935 [Candidatus Doudnabacteria bacterium]|nr:hypothetical protein [Candidatus Doudnabacteria bacterium]